MYPSTKLRGVRPLQQVPQEGTARAAEDKTRHARRVAGGRTGSRTTTDYKAAVEATVDPGLERKLNEASTHEEIDRLAAKRGAHLLEEAVARARVRLAIVPRRPKESEKISIPHSLGRVRRHVAEMVSRSVAKGVITERTGLKLVSLLATLSPRASKDELCAALALVPQRGGWAIHTTVADKLRTLEEQREGRRRSLSFASVLVRNVPRAWMDGVVAEHKIARPLGNVQSMRRSDVRLLIAHLLAGPTRVATKRQKRQVIAGTAWQEDEAPAAAAAAASSSPAPTHQRATKKKPVEEVVEGPSEAPKTRYAARAAELAADEILSPSVVRVAPVFAAPAVSEVSVSRYPAGMSAELIAALEKIQSEKRAKKVPTSAKIMRQGEATGLDGPRFVHDIGDSRIMAHCQNWRDLHANFVELRQLLDTIHTENVTIRARTRYVAEPAVIQLTLERHAGDDVAEYLFTVLFEFYMLQIDPQWRKEPLANCRTVNSRVAMCVWEAFRECDVPEDMCFARAGRRNFARSWFSGGWFRYACADLWIGRDIAVLGRRAADGGGPDFRVAYCNPVSKSTDAATAGSHGEITEGDDLAARGGVIIPPFAARGGRGGRGNQGIPRAERAHAAAAAAVVAAAEARVAVADAAVEAIIEIERPPPPPLVGSEVNRWRRTEIRWITASDDPFDVVQPDELHPDLRAQVAGERIAKPPLLARFKRDARSAMYVAAWQLFTLLVARYHRGAALIVLVEAMIETVRTMWKRFKHKLLTEGSVAARLLGGPASNPDGDWSSSGLREALEWKVTVDPLEVRQEDQRSHLARTDKLGCASTRASLLVTSTHHTYADEQAPRAHQRAFGYAELEALHQMCPPSWPRSTAALADSTLAWHGRAFTIRTLNLSAQCTPEEMSMSRWLATALACQGVRHKLSRLNASAGQIKA